MIIVLGENVTIQIAPTGGPEARDSVHKGGAWTSTGSAAEGSEHWCGREVPSSGAAPKRSRENTGSNSPRGGVPFHRSCGCCVRRRRERCRHR